MRIGIGIDTGGTFTDAVAYDFDAERVLFSCKAQTTREDLAVGIGNALDGIPADLVHQAEIVSLSTTLATNACVENKGGRARLLFIGVDPWVVDWVGRDSGLPAGKEMFFLDARCNGAGRNRQGAGLEPSALERGARGSRARPPSESWRSTPWTTARRWKSAPAS